MTVHLAGQIDFGMDGTGIGLIVRFYCRATTYSGNVQLSDIYAKTTGKPIIGMTYSIARSRILNKSWDRMLFPIPFQRGIVAVTKPFFIPKNTPKENLENYRKQIEDEMNNLTWQLDRELKIPHIEQGTLPRKHQKQS